MEQLLKKENIQIMFFDEGRFGLQSTYTRVWSWKGEVPRVKVKQGFKSTYVYSAVSPFTGESFSLILPGVNTELMNIYLYELSKAFEGQKVVLIMDQAGWHKSKGLKEYSNIDFIFQPAYSPELNPIERLWKWLKKEMLHNRIYESLEQLIDQLSKEYQKLSKEKFKSICACNYL